MTDTTPDFQSIEDAYAKPDSILSHIPQTPETKEAIESARHHLQRSRTYAYEAREKARDPGPVLAPEASMS